MKEDNFENIKLSPNVVETITGIVASNIEGVANVKNSLSCFDKILDLFLPSLNKYIVRSRFLDNQHLHIDLYIDVYPGYNAYNLAQEIRYFVSQEIYMQLGLLASEIDIYIEEIIY